MLLHQAGEQVRLMTGQFAPVEAMDRALAMVLTNS
jgi:shikimate dehydrogenase